MGRNRTLLTLHRRIHIQLLLDKQVLLLWTWVQWGLVHFLVVLGSAWIPITTAHGCIQGWDLQGGASCGSHRLHLRIVSSLQVLFNSRVALTAVLWHLLKRHWVFHGFVGQRVELFLLGSCVVDALCEVDLTLGNLPLPGTVSIFQRILLIMNAAARMRLWKHDVRGASNRLHNLSLYPTSSIVVQLWRRLWIIMRKLGWILDIQVCGSDCTRLHKVFRRNVFQSFIVLDRSHRGLVLDVAFVEVVLAGDGLGVRREGAARLVVGITLDWRVQALDVLEVSLFTLLNYL